MAKTDTETLTTTEVAKEIGTNGRTRRRYLRSVDLGVGQGARYAFDPDEVRELRKGFAAWWDEVARDRSEAKATEDHTCPECGKGFDSARALAGHKASHA